MPEPLERAEFLSRVAESVDLQPRKVGEVIEELNSHLSDAAAGWRDAGYDPDDAERRAIRGLGDPNALGEELGKARRQRRQLLAAVGGGIWAAATFGLFSFVFVWVVFAGLIAVVSIVAIGLVSQPIGGWLTGPVGSLITVGLTLLWFAWMGWALPRAVARSAHRSVVGVRRAVGAAGLVIGSIVIWRVVTMDVDPVLAIGMPLGPLAFLLAARRATRGDQVFPRTTIITRLGIAIALAGATVVLGLATVRLGDDGTNGMGYSADGIGATAFTGDLAGGDPPSVDLAVTSGSSPTLSASAFFPDEAWFQSFAAKYPTTALEVWPLARTSPDMYRSGSAPIAAVAYPTTVSTFERPMTMPMPMPRTPEAVMVALVGVARDGSRVLLDFFPETTPTWHGSLFDWWFGPR